jgi:hypothetical protein
MSLASGAYSRVAAPVLTREIGRAPCAGWDSRGTDTRQFFGTQLSLREGWSFSSGTQTLIFLLLGRYRYRY